MNYNDFRFDKESDAQLLRQRIDALGMTDALPTLAAALDWAIWLDETKAQLENLYYLSR